MAHRINSLADYATKRFRLAGKAYLDEYNPFFAQIDSSRRFEAQAQGAISSASPITIISASPTIRRSRRAAAKREVDDLGVGALASRLVGGERTTHQLFEEEIAGIPRRRERAGAGLGLSRQCHDHRLSHDGKRDAIFIDELSHNSIVYGAEGAPAHVVKFRHNDLDHLDHLLARAARGISQRADRRRRRLQHGRRHGRSAAPVRDQGQATRSG